ncbi:MAG: transcription termination factor NusA [Candidatus Sumerlaeaceae bacterium]|nr:transcription termination factor NusA [Candidatus Sumerlaeaceae bacterium]
MNATELKAFMRQVSKEKDLDINIVRDAIEQAIVSASKKNLSQFIDARPQLDAETGELRLFVTKEVVNIATNPRTQISQRDAKKIRKDAQVGETVEAEVDPAIFGRIAAQSARQVVMQKLRDAERMKVYDEYKAQIGQAVSGIVLRFEKRDIVLSIGKAEAILPRNEMPVTARYRVNDRLKVYVLDIDPLAKGPIIRVSRTHPQLVAKLFEQEVPEIADGTVKIVTVVRDPGSRSKIAVESTNSDVDPVGACVGVKGARVQMIVRELENEKIDIVPFTTNAKQFITSALVPAQIQSIITHEDRKVAEVIVKQGNLSLAIGKKGQNAKLAFKLTGWKLEIHSEGEDRKLAEMNQEKVQRQYLDDFLSQMDKIDEPMKENIYSSPFNSVQGLAEAGAADIVHLVDGDRDLAEQLIEDAKEYQEALREMTRHDFGEDAAEAGAESEGEATAETPEGEGAPAETA